MRTYIERGWGWGWGRGCRPGGKEGWNRVTAFERNIGQAGVYHLPKSSGNFGWNVNGNANWSARPENFRNKRNVVRDSPKLPTGISERKMCVPFAFSTSSRPFGLYLSRWRCLWKWNTHIS